MEQAQEKQILNTAFDEYVAQLHEDLDQIEKEKKKELFKEAERIEKEREQKHIRSEVFRKLSIVAGAVAAVLLITVLAANMPQVSRVEEVPVPAQRVMIDEIDEDMMLTICEKCEGSQFGIDVYKYDWNMTLADLEKRGWSKHSEEGGVYTLHHTNGARILDFVMDQGEDQPFTSIRLRQDEMNYMAITMPFGIGKGYTREKVNEIFDNEKIPYIENEDQLWFAYHATDLEGIEHDVEYSLFFDENGRASNMTMRIEKNGIKQTLIIE